jgi:hypothetical protein
VSRKNNGCDSERAVHWSFVPTTDLNPSGGGAPLAAGPLPKISDEECRLFRPPYLRAPCQGNGLFQLTHIPSPPGRPAKWPYRMSEERDCSDLRDRAARSVGTVAELVIDGCGYRLRDAKGRITAEFRTVSAYASSDDNSRLLALKRRGERRTFDTDDLARPVLDDCLAIVKAHELDISDAPLLSLEPELADPKDRRLLVARGISYAMRLHPHDAFADVMAPLDPAPDVSDAIPVEHIFDVYKPGRDRTQTSPLRVRDLSEPKSGGGLARRIPEVLVEVPVGGRRLHFITWLATRAPTINEGIVRAMQLARRAGQLTLRPPSEALRMHEFHHPRDDGYESVMRIVDYGAVVR